MYRYHELPRIGGLVLSRSLNIDRHITVLCKASYFHLRYINRFDLFLIKRSLITATHSFLISGLSYPNPLLNVDRVMRIEIPNDTERC